MKRFRDVLPLVAWVTTLGVAIVVFTAMGAGQLAAPPMDPGAWSAWADARDPVVATVALLRLVVLGLAWYLAAVTLLGDLARVARLTTMVRFTDAMTVPMVRRVLQTSLGVGLATAVVVSSTTSVPPSAPVLAATTATEVDSEVPVMRPLPPRVAPVPLEPADDPAPSTTTDTTDPADDTPRSSPDPTPSGGRDGDPTVVPAPEATPSPGVTPPPAPDAVHAPSPQATSSDPPRDDVADQRDPPHRPEQRPVPSAPVTPPRATPRAEGHTGPDGSTHLPVAGEASASSVTVEPGDHLWSIAERHLAEVRGRGVSDDEITPYWRRLVEHNRDRLVDPANPDLILPGQQFVLPDVEVVP